jgi:hypothetical protein
MVKTTLTVLQVLAWADAHLARYGRWPTRLTGPVAFAPGETWGGLDGAPAQGRRGVPGGDSLARLLARERGVGRRGWHSQGGRMRPILQAEAQERQRAGTLASTDAKVGKVSAIIAEAAG